MKKKKIVASLLALAMCFSPQSMSAFAAENFKDVPADAGYFEDVSYVCNEGLMDGATPMLFNPDAMLTRGVSVDALYRSVGSPDTSGLTNPFSDVTEEGLYADAVKWAAANQIINGYGDSKFGPEDNITRQDFVAMASRCFDWQKTIIILAQPDILFVDEADIKDYAKNAAQEIIKLGVILLAETNDFNPQGNITRAEASSILHRFDKIEAPY